MWYSGLILPSLGTLLVSSSFHGFVLSGNEKSKIRFALQNNSKVLGRNSSTDVRRNGYKILSSSSSLLSSTCDVDQEASEKAMITAQVLRDAKLTSASNKLIRLGDKIGNQGKSVVVFLRHLG